MLGYVTVEEADAYVLSHFKASDALRKSWNETSADDKQVLLTQSAEAINALPIAGKQTYLNSENAFPRYPAITVPKNIKSAQIENAVALSDDSSVSDAATYHRMWAYGVTSYSIGNLSESIVVGSGGAGLKMGIVSSKAQTLLLPFIGGGYCIE